MFTQLNLLPMELLWTVEPPLLREGLPPTSLALCCMSVLAYCYYIRHHHRGSSQQTNRHSLAAGRAAHGSPWFGDAATGFNSGLVNPHSTNPQEKSSCQVSGCGRYAVVTRPMLLVTLETGSKVVSPTSARRAKISALTGIAPAERITEVMEERIIPITVKVLSMSGLASSGLMAAFDKHLASEFSCRNNSDSVPWKSDSVAVGAGAPCRLSEFVGQSVFRAISGSFFGPTFPCQTLFSEFCGVASDIRLLHTPESRVWPFGSNSVHASRKRMMNGMTAYIEEWWYADGHDRIEGVSPMVERFLQAAKEEELTLEEAAGTLVVILWEAFMNVWLMTFWLMAHTLLDDATHQAIAHEVRNPSHYLTTTPILDSAIQETFRWVAGPQPVRGMDEEAVLNIDGKRYTLRAGTQVVADLTGCHYDEDVYPEAHIFNAKRFMDESLPLPRPFGEGKHMCKGMHLAKLQIRTFVVHAFTQFHLKLGSFHDENRRRSAFGAPLTRVETGGASGGWDDLLIHVRNR